MSACCTISSGRQPSAWARRFREFVAWIVPSTLLALVPKCPMCLAAYVTLWTGLGLSMAAATYIRWAMLFVGVGSLLFLALRRVDRIGIVLNLFRKEATPCHTK